MSLTPGQQVSSYRVVGSLGCGGMGEVYRARDTRLDRDVAIKVLPPGWDDDEDHSRRFVREAKTLASLNHPNIAQVYGFEEVDSRRYLILELVEGEELAERIARGALAWDETREVCLQIAEGLEAAHERGVIHRDLKPANVRITPQGAVKVLDFGLAKPRPHRSSSSEAATRVSTGETYATQAGVLVGTPTYMSPERVRGKPDDRRGDVWAFGCVLYECLVGEPPFDGETLADTMATIVEHEPDLGKLPRTTPPAIRQLIERCLDKDPRTRLRDIGEARVVLERRDLGIQQPTMASRAARRGGIPVVVVLLIAAVAAALGYVVARDDGPGAPGTCLEGAKFSRLTDFPGTEFGATLSRDGRLFAFASDRDGPFDAWIGKVAGGELRNLTQGRRLGWWLHVRDMGFDYDMGRIWFVGGQDLPMTAIDTMGGEIETYYDDTYVNVDWSPDGSRIVYHDWDPGDAAFVADSEGRRPVQIAIGEEGRHQHFPTWSPDGEWIYMTRGRPATGQMDLWRVRPELNGEREQLTFGLPEVLYPAPIDDRTVLFTARDEDGSGPWLWELDVESKRVRRAAVGVEQYLTLAVAADDRRTLVATVQNPTAHIWSVPLKKKGVVATEEDATRLEGLEAVRGFAPRYGDSDLYFLATRGSSNRLWRLRDGTPTLVLRDDDLSVLEAPAASPDGARLALVLAQDGTPRLHVMRADTTIPELLNADLVARGAPTWSPDGRFIAIGGSASAGDGLYVLRADGSGSPERLVGGDALNPAWSPRGDLIVCKGPQSKGGVHSLLAVRPDGSTPDDFPLIQVMANPGIRIRFMPDGSGIVYMQGTTPGQDYWLYDIDTRERTQLTDLAKISTMQAFDIHPDGDRIVFDRIEPNSDIVLIQRR